jgi:NADH dehydrogenase [ubiquinone] 1 alpha subcomplex assembly factor 3
MTASTTIRRHNFWHILHIATTTITPTNQLHNTPVMERPIIQCTRLLSRSLTQTSYRNARPQASAPQQVARTSQRPAHRSLHTTPALFLQPRPPKSRDRGPKSNEDTQTDFSALDVLRNTVAPATSIDACTSDGFALNNQMRISGCGILLIGGEAFRWRPWLQNGWGGVREGEDDEMTGKLLNGKGQWSVDEGAWGVLELCWPKPGALCGSKIYGNGG